LCLVAATGCGERSKTLAPVSGAISFDGKPLASGSISFQPVAQPGSIIAGKGSIAFCDPQGRYQLMTIDDRPGAVVGEHTIRIFGPKTKQIESSDDSGRTSPELLPRRYNFDTELTFTVPPEGTDKADFVLSSK
jgi:hypothetical protein